MTATVHRILVAAGSFFAGLGSVWSLAEVEPLGIPPEVGAACALAGAIFTLAANAWRSAFPSDEEA